MGEAKAIQVTSTTSFQVFLVIELYFRGFYGEHRCGVTLLSAPPRPTVLVSAAHCNSICKDEDGSVVKTCCCRKASAPGTCRSVRVLNMSQSVFN